MLSIQLPLKCLITRTPVGFALSLSKGEFALHEEKRLVRLAQDVDVSSHLGSVACHARWAAPRWAAPRWAGHPAKNMRE